VTLGARHCDVQSTVLREKTDLTLKKKFCIS
jgi:hypothetical protein